MTTITAVSQSDSTNCNFSTENISFRVEHAEYSPSSTNTPQSSYRKSYISWDKLERANKPDNYTEKTRYLSKNAKALLSVVYQKLKKQPVLLLNHKYISTITNSGSRQNQRIIQEIKDVVDVSYKRGITELNERKYKNSYEFKLKNNTIDESIQRTKMSDKNASSTIYRENNNIKIRSRANFVKNSSDSFFTEENHNTEPDNKIEEQGDKTLKTEVASAKENNLTHDTSVIPHNTNGFLDSGKYLSEILDYLTDEMCSTLRSKCGKDYTDKAIKEIAKAVSRSKKGSKAFFYHIKGFIAYLSKILFYEKRDPVKINSINYYITANQTSEEQIIRKQEKYLTDIEYSLQVSPEWHLKKKLAAVLERSKAYNVLTSYKSLNIKENRAIIQLNRFIVLSEIDKDIILQQIQATHEKMDDNENYQQVEFLELVMPDKSVLSTTTDAYQLEQNFPKREGVWGKIRESFAKSFASGGDNLDKAWTSHLRVEIDNNNKTINLFAPTAFISDWINSNYRDIIEKVAKDNGINLGNIAVIKE